MGRLLDEVRASCAEIAASARSVSIDLARAAELRFATLPALRKQLADLEQTLVGHQTSGRLVREELDEDDVAAVVAESTGRDADSPTQLELVHAARAASGSRRTST